MAASLSQPRFAATLRCAAILSRNARPVERGSATWLRAWHFCGSLDGYPQLVVSAPRAEQERKRSDLGLRNGCRILIEPKVAESDATVGVNGEEPQGGFGPSHDQHGPVRAYWALRTPW